MLSSFREFLSWGNFASSFSMFYSRYRKRLWLAEDPKLTMSLIYIIIFPNDATSLPTFAEDFSNHYFRN